MPGRAVLRVVRVGRVTADPTGLGMFPTWAFSWPANRRVMYNRASADAEGKPWDPSRAGIVWLKLSVV